MRRWFLRVAGFALLIGIVLARPARCADPPSGDSYKPPSVDETLNDDSSTSALNNWRGGGDGGYRAQQIIDDARLAHQLTASSNPASSDLMSGGGIKKQKHLSPAIVVAAAVAGFVLLVTLILFIWTRFIGYREMREAPEAFQISGSPRPPRD